MIVPLLARGQVLAALAVGSCRPDRRYGASDLRLAEELARRAGLTLDNVRLYQESRFQAALTTNLSEGVILIRQRDATIVYANPRLEAMFGYAPQELLGRPVSVINAPGELSPEDTAASIIAELDAHGEWHGEVLNIAKGGRPLWCYASVCTFQHEAHGTVWISVHTDITERKRLEAENARALRDKEALLREIHHRVKNNLQVISSLFSLQITRTANEDVRALLEDSRRRVHAIAMVHEHLYQSTSLAAVDFDPYLRALLQSIAAAYGRQGVTLDVRVEDVILDADRAVPCALLVAELVSNAFKHAFAGSAGTIRVRARRDDGAYVFEVSDDGRGLPKDLDWRDTRSLGLRLVHMFAAQLAGTLVIDQNHGARFTLRFPAHSAESSIVQASPQLISA